LRFRARDAERQHRKRKEQTDGQSLLHDLFYLSDLLIDLTHGLPRAINDSTRIAHDGLRGYNSESLLHEHICHPALKNPGEFGQRRKGLILHSFLRVSPVIPSYSVRSQPDGD
jgi:hypothetical protein